MKLKPFPNEYQLDVMDCGPACLKMISKYYGKYYTLHYLREKCGNNREGVSLSGIAHAAEAIGLRTIAAHCTTIELIEKIPLPIIIHWNNSHFVILYDIRIKRNRTVKFYISDPAKGKIIYDRSEFEEKWIKRNENKTSGIALLLEPRADFKQREEGERPERAKLLENILGYFTPYKKSFVYLGIVMLLITLMQAVLPFISKAVIDVGIQTKDVSFVNIVLVANLALILSITLSSAVRDWILQQLSSRINISLISDYLIKLMKLPVSFFDNKMLGDILQRANDHERIRSFIMNNSLNLIFSTLTFLIFSIILLIYNTTIFYIFIGGSLIYVLWIMAFFKLRKKLDWDYFDLTAKNQSYWVETMGAIQDIKINNYELAKRWKWEAIQARLFKVNLRMLGINNIQSLGANFFDSVKNLLITFFCAKAVIAGDITFGVMISTQFIIGMLNGPVQQLIMFMISFQFAQISFLRLNEIHLSGEMDIIVNNVSFQYTNTSPVILKNINLVIPKGKVTAIVGDSGSGKSTLLKLLLRLYKPSFGEILIGGMNINNLNLQQWRDRCGAVMQDGKIFNDTILNNITLDDEKIDKERLKNAISAANIALDIEQLPLGYLTRMGENGRGLSGGQKQRVLIARALYKDPDLLFFDEATNSLDAINEKKITEALDEIFSGKTVIVVAHRLSTIRKAHQIIVMKDGRIVEMGDHESLIERKGRYYQLVHSQSEIRILEN